MIILTTGKLKTYIYECRECGCVFTGNSEEALEYSTVLGITYPVMMCPWCKKKRVTGSPITEEELLELSKKIGGNNDESLKTRRS